MQERPKTIREFLFAHLEERVEYWDRSLRHRGEFHNKETRIKFREQFRAAIQALKALEDAELQIEVHLQSDSNIELGSERSVAEHIAELKKGVSPHSRFHEPLVYVRLVEEKIRLPEEYWGQIATEGLA